MSTGLAPTQFPNPPEKSALSFSFPARYAHFGPFDLDLRRQELFKDGTRVKLQGKVYEVLLILVENSGKVVTREALRARLWPLDAQVNYDANVNTTVNKLRQMLGDSPDVPSFVETIPRKGYSFVGKVEFIDQPSKLANKEMLPVQIGPDAEIFKDNSSFFSMAKSKTWFKAGAIALVLAGMLFGAALVLYGHRGAAAHSSSMVAPAANKII